MANSTSVLTSLIGGTGLLADPVETNVAAQWGVPVLIAPATFATAASPAPAALRAVPRLCLLLGEGATPRGVASQVQDDILAKVTGAVWASVPPGERDRLGAALFRVATEINFGTAAPLELPEANRHWSVGTLFPLPVWQGTGPGNTPVWQVDVDRIATALAAVHTGWVATERNQGVLAARPLHGYDPVGDPAPVPGPQRFAAAMAARTALRTLVTGSATGTTAAAGFNASAEGTRLGVEARWNPYAVLFRLVETLLAFDHVTDDTVQKGLIQAFAAGYWNALSGPERRMQLSTSAGYAIARQLWLWWSAAGAPDASLRTALGLADDDLARRQPAVEGDLEPPMAGRPPLPTSTAATNGKDLPIMAFGRRVPFIGQNYPLAKPNFFGIGWAGEAVTTQYLTPDPGDPLVRPFTDAVLPAGTPAQQAAVKEQWFRILAAISRVEGALDGVSACDSGMCSLGFQQWSMHIATEGAGLLERLKWLSPPYYDLVVRGLGIETGRRPVAGPSGGADITDLDADACFYTLSPTAAPARHLVPADSDTKAQKASYADDVRRTVFDWTKAGGKWTVGRRAMLLAARWSVAARYGVEVWRAEAELAVNRINRMAARLARPAEAARWAPVLALPGLPRVTPPVPARVPTVQELYGTEALLAAALDMAINTPDHFAAAMRRAVARAVAIGERDALVTQPPATATLDDTFHLLLFLAFMAERHWFGGAATSVRQKAIDVSPGRTVALVEVAGSLRDRSAADALPAALAAALRGFGIPRQMGVSLTRPAVWP